MLRFMDARCINKNHLCIISCVNALYLIPCGLRLIAHDGDFLPDHLVDESGLPDIRASNDRNKA